ncbi:MAG: carbohydrate ABC transporter permease [Chloroflexota bacterium]|nr:carbohydrate ABC transporter permease [Chloroflexota bacterium]
MAARAMTGGPKSRPPRRIAATRWSQALIYAALALIFLVMAYPFFYVISLAVMPYDEYVRQPIHAWPSGFTLSYFREVLRDPRLVQAFQISILKTVVGTILSVVATAMAGYALSRPGLRYGRILSFLFLVPLFVTGGLIPYYLVIRATGLLNTFWALVIPGVVASFYLFIVRTYFRSYPQEVIEAATIDGAGQFRIFWQIVWPTSTPIIATIAMLYGTAHWNEYYWPSVLVQADLHPATVVLQNITTSRSVLQGLGVGTQMTPQSFIAAVAAILIIPMLIAYPFVQRFIVKGILLGSVKG